MINHMSFKKAHNQILQSHKNSKDDVPVESDMTEDEVKKFEEDWTCGSGYHQK